MHDVEWAVDEIRRLHEEMLQAPAPEPTPYEFVPFPPGVDPVAFAVDEVLRLRQAWEQMQPRPAEVEAPPVQVREPQVAEPGPWVPRASVFSAPSGVRFQVEIPGIERGDLSVTVEAGEVVVRGQRRPPQLERAAEPVVVEQPWGVFERRFAVPVGFNPESTTARYEQGMLDIRIEPRSDDLEGEYQVEIG